MRQKASEMRVKAMKMAAVGGAVSLLALNALAAGGPFAGAKWIGGNAVTLPDYDFGAAQWIAPKGVLASGWKRVGGAVELTVEVPAGTEAEIRLGGRAERVVGPWKGTRTDVP